jgi:hypothetical protein
MTIGLTVWMGCVEGAVMERAAARKRFAEDAVRFPVDFSGVSEESGREALEALRKAVAGRRRIWVDEEQE